MSDEGSTFKVPYTKILNITPHSGADKLEIAWVYGFQVIVQKDKYKVGQEIVYVPIDSVFNDWELEAKIFPVGSKVKLNKHRVRQIRLRGLASQGLIIDPNDIAEFLGMDKVRRLGTYEAEQDLANDLRITKYDPPAPGPAQTIGKNKERNKRTDNPHFRKFNGVDNLKWFPDLFTENDQVIVQEKIHGTHVRFGKAPFIPRTWFQKLRKVLHLLPEWENVYGSNNVEITSAGTYKGYYSQDLYGAVLKKYDVFSKIQPNEFVHGEIYGPSIQKNYTYGSDEHKLIVFDVRVLNPDGTQKWLNPEDVEIYCEERGFDFVPVLYRGPYNKEWIAKLCSGPSVLAPSQKVREGIVIKDRWNYDVDQNKKALKLINEDYLDDKSNSDFH